MALSIRLCSSHRHFPKKIVFFPLQDQILGQHAQDTLTEVVLARAFSAVPSCFWSVLLRVHRWKWLDAPHTAARFPHATPSRVATPVFIFWPNTAIWATHKVYWAGDVTGMGVSSLFRSPATLDLNNSVTVAPVHFLFCYNKPEVESFRSRVRLSKSSKN